MTTVILLLKAYAVFFGWFIVGGLALLGAIAYTGGGIVAADEAVKQLLFDKMMPREIRSGYYRKFKLAQLFWPYFVIKVLVTKHL